MYKKYTMYKVYEMYKVYGMYKVYAVYKMSKVYKVNRVLLPPQTSPTSVGFIDIFTPELKATPNKAGPFYHGNLLLPFGKTTLYGKTL